MKLGFWVYQGIAIVFSLLSLAVMPITVYFNYSMVDEIEQKLGHVESALHFAPVVYFLLLVVAIVCCLWSFFIARKEGKKFYYWIIGPILILISVLSFGMDFIYLSTLTFPK